MPILNLSEVDLYYETTGTGDPVVFIQGVGVLGQGWSPQTESLSKKFHTITIDNRGIGQSTLRSMNFTVEAMADDVLAVIDQLGLKTAHIVGHSMGGSIALEFAIKYPERVRSLSLLCTFLVGKQALKLNPRIFWLGIKTRIGSRQSRRDAFLEILFSRKHLASGVDRKNLAEVTGQIVGRDLADSPSIIMDQLKALSRHNRYNDLKSLAGIPTLVANAKEDPIALPEFGRDLAANIPNARFILLENASHGIVLERPEEINQLLLDHFLNC